MSDVWEHFNMSVRDDDDRIVLKFVMLVTHFQKIKILILVWKYTMNMPKYGR